MTLTQSQIDSHSPVSDNVSYRVPTDSSTDFGTLAPDTTINPSPPTAAQVPSKTAAHLPLPPPLRHSTCSRKSIKQPDFAYSFILSLSFIF